MVDGPDTIASEPAMRYVGWLDGDASSDTHCRAERRIEACEQGFPWGGPAQAAGCVQVGGSQSRTACG